MVLDELTDALPEPEATPAPHFYQKSESPEQDTGECCSMRVPGCGQT